MLNIERSMYKDIPALLLTTAKLAVKILPEQGGRIASIRSRETGKEFLIQNDSVNYKKMGLTTGYSDAECSGFDEMFPCIDPWTLTGKNGDVLEYLDHGEVCRIPHQYEIGEGALRIWTETSHVPATFVRRITEAENGGLHIDYAITNNWSEDLPCIWAAHFMIAGEPGGTAITPCPEGTQAELTFSVDASKGGRFDKVRFPYFADGTRLDRNNPRSENTNSWKYYFSDKLPGNYLGYRYPSDGTRFMLYFDEKKTPYAGLWYNDGAPAYCYGYAPELATGSFDRPDTAMERGQCPVLKPGEKQEFFLEFTVE